MLSRQQEAGRLPATCGINPFIRQAWQDRLNLNEAIGKICPA
jgi:hypothetical protein